MFFNLTVFAHNRSFSDIFIQLGITFIILIIFLVYHSYQDYQKRKRDDKIANFAKRKNLRFLPFFSEPLKQKDEMNCFSGMIDLSFVNVIDKSDLDNKARLYIGDLKWVGSSNGNTISKGNVDFSPRMGMDSSFAKVKHYANMCVFFDNRFELPDFDLSRETLGKKTVEVLKLNNTEDIDFDDDKDFSDAWWLSSNMNMVVRDLFTKEIRKKFMKYVDKDYRIVGRNNMLLIITNKLYEPEDYNKIESDMRAISNILKTNKKFYNPDLEA